MREFASFAFVGLVNTGVHLTILVWLVEGKILGSSGANIAAFLTANVFSYCVNSLVTFRRRLAWSRYYGFVICSSVGTGLAYLFSMGAEWMHWSYIAGFLMTVLFMPPVNFWFVRRFVFPHEGNFVPRVGSVAMQTPAGSITRRGEFQ